MHTKSITANSISCQNELNTREYAEQLVSWLLFSPQWTLEQSCIIFQSLDQYGIRRFNKSQKEIVISIFLVKFTNNNQECCILHEGNSIAFFKLFYFHEFVGLHCKP